MKSTKPAVELTTPIHALPGVGPKRRITLEKAGLRTVEDLLYYFPHKYEDRRHIRPISSVKPGESVLIAGSIYEAKIIGTRRRRFSVFQAVAEDETGTILLKWFNQPWLADKVVAGARITAYGQTGTGRYGELEMQNPRFQIGEDEGETGIVPIYGNIGSVGSKMIHNLIDDLLAKYSLSIAGAVPEVLHSENRLMQPAEALLRIHRPPDDADINLLNQAADVSHRSLIFDEFFMLQAGIALRKGDSGHEEVGLCFETNDAIRQTLKGMLPFHLTDGQRNALKDIVEDTTSGRPMRRLLQGDVGCGKTIVALLAAGLAMENGYQVALMAPTEILAEQHLLSVRERLAHTRYRIGFLTGSLTLKEREEMRARIASGDVDFIVGTHAMIQEGVQYKRLGLAIIDEQHRFGVLQRARLAQLAGDINPHVLIMTATPIPRSLTLTLFGDLDISVIREMPPGRYPIVTAVRTAKDLGKIHSFINTEIAAGRQVYAVAPTIDSDRDGELTTVLALHERLSQTFPMHRVGLLHGQMKAAERERVMADFSAGRIKILASTTVIEVGVDVPNASVMLIENAERFGLAQLHQLRGRVGRGRFKSYCILLYKPVQSENARERLHIMEKTSDGFIIAEKDLELRGPGDFFGTRQSGLPVLRAGNIVRDIDLLQKAREAAFAFILERREKNPGDWQHTVDLIRRHWERRYGLVLIG